jgi:predicted acetyltransferase
MPLTVRTIDASELPGWVACMGEGFFKDLTDEYAEYFAGEVDFGRTWAAVDGKQVVGTLRSFETELTVPGSLPIPAAALTNVTVSATHRRNGLLTSMITADLAASADRGEPVNILIASEYPIYGRFGYGPAVEGAAYSVDTVAVRFRQPSIGSVQRVDLAELRRKAPQIYERFRRAQPGAIKRSERWWDRTLRQVEVPGEKPPKGYAAIYRSPDGEAEGYLRYRGKQNWDNFRPQGTLVVEDLCAVTAAAYQRLWQSCCDVDLMTSIEAGTRSVHEPLPFLLADGRVVQQTGRHDFLWVRVLDVCASLAARRYAADCRLVIDVPDPLGIAGGRYVLEAGVEGAQCTRTGETADLTLPIDALGSVYLGGTSLFALAAAGRVDEHRAGALAEADTMFGSYRPPWCNTWF